MQDGLVNDKRVMEVLALIASRYRQPLTRDVLARHVNLSPSRLHSLFRRQLNTTPRALIMAKRMETAAELLRTTHLLVKEVAARVGIQDDSHFVRDFAKVYGLSPTAYRQAHSVRRTVHFVRDSGQSVQAAGQMANR